MNYSVIVKRIETKVEQRQEWVRMRDEPKDGDPDKILYGYAPALDRTVIEQVPVLDITVEHVDLAALVRLLVPSQDSKP